MTRQPRAATPLRVRVGRGPAASLSGLPPGAARLPDPAGPHPASTAPGEQR